MLSAFSNLLLSISCLMFSLAICAALTCSSASVLSLPCCKPLKDMPFGKQDVFHVLSLKLQGLAHSVLSECLSKNQCERSCLIAT